MAEEWVPQCGHIAVYNSCRLLGVSADLSSIRGLLPDRAEGTSFGDLKRAFSSLGIEADGLQITFDALCASRSPKVAHVRDHFLVVGAATPRSIKVLDDLGGFITVNPRDFCTAWDGKVLDLQRHTVDIHAQGKLEGPRAQFGTLLVDLGPVEDLTHALECVFHVRNVGAGELTISAVRTDCACGVASDLPSPMAPGQSAPITIRLDLREVHGRFIKSAFVHSNDPRFPVIKLDMAGTVQPRLRVASRALTFGDVTQGDVRDICIVALWSGESPCELTAEATGKVDVKVLEVNGVKLGAHGTAVHDLAVKGGERRYIVEATADTAGWRLGDQRGEIDIRAYIGGEQVSAVSVPFGIRVVDAARPTPCVLFLGRMVSGIEYSAVVDLSLRDHAPFRVQAVRSSLPAIVCHYDSDLLREHRIAFFAVARPDKGAYEGDVAIDYLAETGGTTRTVSIPVYGYIVPSVGDASVSGSE